MQHTLGNQVVPTSKFQVFLKIIWDGPSQVINDYKRCPRSCGCNECWQDIGLSFSPMDPYITGYTNFRQTTNPFYNGPQH
jgi:hypothetical protein